MKEGEKVIIERLEGGGYNVTYNGKDTDVLCPDEALGVIAALISTERCLGWLETKEEREDKRAQWAKAHNVVEVELKLLTK
jgi:hypothetical protein